jgi:hypothetical protein
LLTHEEGAERRVPQRLEREARFRFDDAFSEDPGPAAVDVMHDEGRSSEVADHALEQLRHG